MIDLGSLSIAQKFGMAFAFTYVVLILVLIRAIWADNPDIVVARRALLGLIIMSMFALGYAVGNHTGIISLNWTTKDIVQALIALTFLVLAFVVIGTLNVANPDIASAKRSITGMGYLSVIAVIVNFMGRPTIKTIE